VRAKTSRNKDLPGSLRAQPLPLTRSSLERNSRRSNNSIADLVNSNARTISRGDNQHWQSWKSHLSGQGSSQKTSRNSWTTVESRTDGTGTPRRTLSGSTRHDTTPSSQSHRTSTSGIADERPKPPSKLPPGATPIRDNADEVLCRSSSRGYMVVRRLLSLESLRQIESLRKAGSLIGLVEDQ
jgi:hypothetical protein